MYIYKEVIEKMKIFDFNVIEIKIEDNRSEDVVVFSYDDVIYSIPISKAMFLQSMEEIIENAKVVRSFKQHEFYVNARLISIMLFLFFIWCIVLDIWFFDCEGLALLIVFSLISLFFYKLFENV